MISMHMQFYSDDQIPCFLYFKEISPFCYYSNSNFNFNSISTNL